MTERTKGVMVKIIDTNKLGVTDALTTGVITNCAGDIRTINEEGVQDNGVGKDNIFTGYAVYGFIGYHEFTRDEIENAMTDEAIDLSEFVRVFGDRLERNFSLAYYWATKAERTL